MSPSRSAAGWATAVGLLLGQALGIAPAEETFFLPNLVTGNSGHRHRVARIAVQLGLDFLVGVVYAVLNLRTANLFLVIGIHALQNAGTSILATPIDPSLAVLLLAVVIVLATFARTRGRLLGRSAHHREKEGVMGGRSTSSPAVGTGGGAVTRRRLRCGR